MASPAQIKSRKAFAKKYAKKGTKKKEAKSKTKSGGKKPKLVIQYWVNNRKVTKAEYMKVQGGYFGHVHNPKSSD